MKGDTAKIINVLFVLLLLNEGDFLPESLS